MSAGGHLWKSNEYDDLFFNCYLICSRNRKKNLKAHRFDSCFPAVWIFRKANKIDRCQKDFSTLMSKNAFFISELPKIFKITFFVNKFLKNRWKIRIAKEKTILKKKETFSFYDKNYPSYRQIKILPITVKKKLKFY